MILVARNALEADWQSRFMISQPQHYYLGQIWMSISAVAKCNGNITIFILVRRTMKMH